MSYGADKLGVDGHTQRQTDAGNDNTRRPKLASGKNVKLVKTFLGYHKDRKLYWITHKAQQLLKVLGLYLTEARAPRMAKVRKSAISHYTHILPEKSYGRFGKQQKDSHLTFWFPENGLAQTTSKYCYCNVTLTCSFMGENAICNVRNSRYTIAMQEYIIFLHFA